MNQELIKELLEILSHSPNNIPLKVKLGKCYLAIFEFENAETQFLEVLRIDSNHISSKEGLATIYFQQGKYSTSQIILEELVDEQTTTLSILELYCDTLLKLEENNAALEIYQRIVTIDPKYTNPDFDNTLRVSSVTNTDEAQVDEDALNFITKSDIKFEDVGGMNDVKKEISLKIIKPLLHPDLYKAYGKKIGGGILLYGPPGCGKTFIAKATAGEIDANFINVGINDILDMWMGNSEQNLHEIFETARKNKPCVIFIDEIDALGANRNNMNNNTAGRTAINQFLAELDGMNSDNDGILVLGATNTPWHIDPAFRRPGRFDRIIFVAPPDESARIEIFNSSLKDKPTETIDTKKLAKNAKGFSGADIQAVIDIAIEEKLEDSFETGNLELLTNKSLLKAIKKVKPSTKEWFTSAKNYALYSNDSGLYDDVLKYLNIKK